MTERPTDTPSYRDARTHLKNAVRQANDASNERDLKLIISYNSTQLDKICLSFGYEIQTYKWGDADNMFIQRSMQKRLEYRVSHVTESS